jgi:UDP-glucose 4-epimerase
MRFLITGGAGFIGAALANRLFAQRHDVHILDDLHTGDLSRLHSTLRESHFTQGDVNDIPKMWHLLKGVECVYHLAARVSVQESVLYPHEYNAINVGGTVSVLEAMRDTGVKRVVFSSSGAVYGDQMVQPLRETMPPNPRSPYAVSKLAAEYYIRTIGSLWQIETVSLRIFNAYGPRQQMPPSHPPVIPYFLTRALRGGSLVVHGSGQQTRDFVYIDDVVNALVAAATAPDIDRMVINVGSGEETSISALVQAVEIAVGRAPAPLPTPSTDPGVARMKADLTVAGQKLGFKPQISLAEGLRRMIKEDARFAATAR